jgi:hypothetical protein
MSRTIVFIDVTIDGSIPEDAIVYIIWSIRKGSNVIYINTSNEINMGVIISKG